MSVYIDGVVVGTVTEREELTGMMAVIYSISSIMIFLIVLALMRDIKSILIKR